MDYKGIAESYLKFAFCFFAPQLKGYHLFGWCLACSSDWNCHSHPVYPSLIPLPTSIPAFHSHLLDLFVSIKFLIILSKFVPIRFELVLRGFQLTSTALDVNKFNEAIRECQERDFPFSFLTFYQIAWHLINVKRAIFLLFVINC